METPLRTGLTYEDYCRLDDGRRYELIGGELWLVPSPSVYHQRLSIRLSSLLYNHVEENNLGVVLEAPLDVYLTPEDVVQPDIIFVSRERLDIIGEANIQGAPDLVMEILSPSTAVRDRTKKKDLYARHGVKEMWVIHPVAQTIEVYVHEAGGYGKPAVYTARQKDRIVSKVLKDWNITPEDVF
ncbi:MAG: Uma2 family endonuclease [Thermoanaerobacteraceae bacterium]|nr:Uma2 family endonuclease [Thermoanaerobacteraceae bacterium]